MPTGHTSKNVARSENSLRAVAATHSRVNSMRIPEIKKHSGVWCSAGRRCPRRCLTASGPAAQPAPRPHGPPPAPASCAPRGPERPASSSGTLQGRWRHRCGGAGHCRQASRHKGPCPCAASPTKPLPAPCWHCFCPPVHGGSPAGLTLHLPDLGGVRVEQEDVHALQAGSGGGGNGAQRAAASLLPTQRTLACRQCHRGTSALAACRG